MPLPKRSIEPVHVSRSIYQQDELQSVELETVTNTTLTNIIRQLSSLSKYAEDVFGELARDVGNIGDRANSLQARIDRLAIKVTQLDSTVEDVPLTDITRKKAFKSAKVFDQQIFSRATMPMVMLETYSQCDKPPPLDKLNVYRDDGKDGLKFYTDPNYFFELWRQEMLKDTERVMHDKGKKMHRPRQDGCGGSGGTSNRNHKKRVRTPHNTREKQRQIAIGHGETIMPNNVVYRTPNSVTNEEIGYSNMSSYEIRPTRPNSIELRRNYQMEQFEGGGLGVLTPQPTISILNSGNSLQQAGLQQQLYDDTIFQQTLYGQMVSPDVNYGLGTPSRVKPRPSQPPPAPPSSGSGGPTTPNISNANTPTRGRSISTNRDALPPPPPIPEGTVNTLQGTHIATINGGTGHIAAKLLTRTNSISRTDSPQRPTNNSIQDANAHTMSQINNTINNFNNFNINKKAQQINPASDLPPPPLIPEQSSPKLSPCDAVPPPPPPPPPLDIIGRLTHQRQHQIFTNSVSNGEVSVTQSNGITIAGTGSAQHIIGSKKLLTPFQDTRTDLMKAIRDGITLRKVEKCEQKEIERNTTLHDVASILARRVAIELSESDDSDSEEDSEGWMETNETSA